MKMTIENYITGSKKITIDVVEIEMFLKKEGIKRPLFYKEMANAILELLEKGKLSPVKSSKRYAMDNRIFNRYKKVENNEETNLYKNEILTNYDPRMTMTSYLKRIDQYKKDKEYLKAISQFLVNKRRVEPFISINERSYQLLGNEKLLFSEKGNKILKNIGLTYNDLCCYLTYEPFFYYRIDQDEEEGILIVENKDTFFSFKKLFMEGVRSWNGISFSMLIYGEGNKITKSIEYLEELQIPATTPVYYFGDFDPMGMTIFYRLKTSSTRGIHLMIPFYKEMWKHRKESIVKNDQEWNECAIKYFSTCLEKEEQVPYIQYLRENKYIPQEALHIERLRGLSDGANQAVSRNE
jgi:hypothetical protein